ncbi:autotransporter-associated beta strand repeat-containing protein [Limisphaera sp. VF-2]|jgi:autotransporter-associated beta strand protein|uniref:autotransporter-associated beta strand repeat-containing protein n=1 Tax=Limisphaera sp. VF-2 TaxID=3400418 RepID=UPI003C243A12
MKRNASGQRRFLASTMTSVVMAGAILGWLPLGGLAAVYQWTGSGGNLFWSHPANWLPEGLPGQADDVRFFDPGAATEEGSTTVVLPGNATVRSLWFGQTNGFHRLELQDRAQLVLGGSGSVTALLVGTESDNGNGQSVAAAITGTGASLVISNPAAVVAVRQASANAGPNLRARLDLSGLEEVTWVAGRLLVGSESPVAPRPSGTVWLGRTNRLVLTGAAPALAIGGRGGNNNGGNSSYLYLGEENWIFTDSIMIGRGKQGGDSSILFHTNAFAQPRAVFRAADGQGRVASWNIADSENISGTVPARGSAQFVGGLVDALVDTLFIGKSTTGSGTGTPAGYWMMEYGILDVNRLYAGYQSRPDANGARGTVHVVGPAVIRVNELLELAHVSGGTGAAQVEGTLNVTLGQVLVTGRFLSGGGRVFVNITNGSVTLPEGSELFADSVNLDGGRLTNAAVISVSNQLVAVNGSAWHGAHTFDMGIHGTASWDLSGLEGGLVVARRLSGAGTLVGEVRMNPGSTLEPGGPAHVGTLMLTHGLTLDQGQLRFDLGASAGGANDFVQTFDQLRVRGPQQVWLTPLEGSFDTSQPYTLLGASQVVLEDARFDVAGPMARSRYTFQFDTSQPGTVRLLVGGSPPRTLTWVGNGAANRWNVQGDANWNNGTGPDRFYNLDGVVFDDSGSAAQPVTVEEALVPASLTFRNSTKSYRFVGPGQWDGGSVVLEGDGLVRIENTGSNRFDSLTLLRGSLVFAGTQANQIGGTLLNVPAGALLVFSNAGPNLLPPSVALDGTLVWAQPTDGTLAASLSGAGRFLKQGAGQLTLAGDNSGLTATPAVEVHEGVLQVLSANSLPSTGVLVTNAGTLDVNGVNLGALPVTLSGWGANGQGALVNNTGNPNYVSPHVRDVTLAGDTAVGGTGRLDIRSPGGSSGDPATARLSTEGRPLNLYKVGPNGVYIVSVTVDPALADIEVRQGVLAFEGTTTSMGNPQRTLTVFPGATLQFYRTTNAWDKQFVLHGSGTNLTVNNASWTNRLVGPITLVGPCWFNAGGDLLIVDSPIRGDGSLIKLGGATLRLGGVSSHTGDTIVSNGTLQVEGRLERTRQVWVAGGMLTGTGVIAGPIRVLPGGTLAPAGAKRGSLTATNVLVLEGTVEMDVFRSGSGTLETDQIRGLEAVQFGGTLRLNLTGTALQAGDVLPLFEAKQYSGSFGAIEPTTPGPDLAWDTTWLARDGTLRVTVPAPAQPRIDGWTWLGSELRLTGSGGSAGGTYRVWASTNVALPAAAWWPVRTNRFDATGAFQEVLPVEPGVSPLFYRLSVP